MAIHFSKRKIPGGWGPQVWSLILTDSKKQSGSVVKKIHREGWVSHRVIMDRKNNENDM
ncbi:GNAT family acetyltransferase [Desmospora sp. 8437]|nr:GNAT family acetyltransferase [Desmospora sp. 8437]